MKHDKTSNETLIRHKVAGVPLIGEIIQRMGLRRRLCEAIGQHGNETVPAVDTLILLIINLALGKQPLYELEQWVRSLDLRPLGYQDVPKVKMNDDRFGRALDKLYQTDRASLMTRLVMDVVKAFDLKLHQIHNDSTTLKSYGKYPGRTETGFELQRGHSKDHRPDLKQLVYSLSLCSDGAVPVHQKTYSGNRTDDTTHIETWNTLRRIQPKADFLYVADAKLCTDKQLHYIVRRGGRVLTIMPETWAEVPAFKQALRHARKAKKEIWRRLKPGSEIEMEYFSAFTGTHLTKKRGYRIHWIYASEKRQRDRQAREQRLRQAEEALATLGAKINTRRLKTQQAVQEAVDAILARYQIASFYHVDIDTMRETRRVQIGRGRPGKDTRYRRVVQSVLTLGWRRRPTRLHQEARTDGVFPLLCTDPDLTAKEAIQAYKYQPRLEKRFSQFKHIHQGAPLLFKRLERIEATMFAFFIALMIQALIERQVRHTMADRKIPALALYPEDRDASHPTTAKIMGIFEEVSTYRLTSSTAGTREFRDDLTETQQIILKLLNIPEEVYWTR